MLIVQDILISDDVVDVDFVCQLSACKGACCWEGDFGAPLEEAERHTLSRIYPEIRDFLSPAGRACIEEQGLFTYYEEPKEFGTPLLPDGACAYLTYEVNGIAKCGIEKAWEAGVTDFKKPISCHLYPIRVTSSVDQAFEALNYDRWDICSAACSNGKKLQVPVYQFVKEALVRKYGVDFYEELDQMAAYLKNKG